MNWTMKDSVESLMTVQTVDLKNCTKEMVVEHHNKTVYECHNVTKRHCTTLWTINDIGEKLWTGNEVKNIYMTEQKYIFDLTKISIREGLKKKYGNFHTFADPSP